MSPVRPQSPWPRGTVARLMHRSRVLEDNPWQDPAEREVAVYLPHGYTEAGSPWIALWDLAACTSAGPGHLNWRNQGENLPARLDRLIGEGGMEPVVVVIPDCYTSLGGNQYVNSVGVGRYADYLVEELVPFLGARFNLVAGREGRGLFGKSSGGYGALYHAMHYPDTWGAAASHAADLGFDLLFRAEFPAMFGDIRKVEQVITDHGSQFYANRKDSYGNSESSFETFLKESEIKHIMGRINHPQTNGKLEKWYDLYEKHRDKFESFDIFVNWYNIVRFHESLDTKHYLQTPDDAFLSRLPQACILNLFLKLLEDELNEST